MFTNLARRADDILALAGFVMVIAGVYGLLGLWWSLILAGATLIYAGIRLQTEEQNGQS